MQEILTNKAQNVNRKGAAEHFRFPCTPQHHVVVLYKEKAAPCLHWARTLTVYQGQVGRGGVSPICLYRRRKKHEDGAVAQQSSVVAH
jgi:hypothetical protein